MINYQIADSEDITHIADAIRDRTGTTATLMWPDDFITEINKIGTNNPQDPTEPSSGDKIDINTCYFNDSSSSRMWTGETIVFENRIWRGNKRISAEGNIFLQKDIDYEIDDESELRGLEPGESHYFTVIGKGDYTGSRRRHWTIGEEPITDAVWSSTPDANTSMSKGQSQEYTFTIILPQKMLNDINTYEIFTYTYVSKKFSNVKVSRSGNTVTFIGTVTIPEDWDPPDYSVNPVVKSKHYRITNVNLHIPVNI